MNWQIFRDIHDIGCPFISIVFTKLHFDNNEIVISESPNSLCIQRLQSTIIDTIFKNTKAHIRRMLRMILF